MLRASVCPHIEQVRRRAPSDTQVGACVCTQSSYSCVHSVLHDTLQDISSITAKQNAPITAYRHRLLVIRTTILFSQDAPIIAKRTAICQYPFVSSLPLFPPNTLTFCQTCGMITRVKQKKLAHPHITGTDEWLSAPTARILNICSHSRRSIPKTPCNAWLFHSHGRAKNPFI